MRTFPALPSLLALRAFEAAGRLTSFRRAGEELLITQSAVSHHIKRLETDLGLRLFVRGGRTIALTREGASYLETVQGAFHAISDGARRLRERPGDLRVSLLPSFAANWLAPRLTGLQAALGSVNVILDPTLRIVDLKAGEADLAIRYGDGSWSDGDCRLLFQEILTPVVSPRLLSKVRINQADDLRCLTLLETHRPKEWAAWATGAGVDLSDAKFLQLVDYNVAVQAALDGQGVALGRMTMIGHHIQTGALVQPLNLTISSRQTAYWLVTRASRPLRGAAKSFEEWLNRQISCQLQSD